MGAKRQDQGHGGKALRVGGLTGGHARARAITLVACAGATMIGCGDVKSLGAQELSREAQELKVPALFSSRDDVKRVRSSVVFDTLWVFGGPSDTLLAHPRVLRHDRALGVVFFDIRNQAAYRIGAGGNLLWSWGTRGEGPGELKRVRAMDVAPDGSVVLVDAGNQRVVRLSSDGRLLEEKPMPVSSPTIEVVAALPGGRLAVSGHNPFLALWDADDVVAAELPDDLGEPSPVQHYGIAARWGDQGWVYGFRYGNGWMPFQGAELLGVFPYVEHAEFPVLRQVRQGNSFSSYLTAQPPRTANSLSVVGDTLHVLFGGTGRVLDKFNVRSGAYLETDFLPHLANEAVVGGDRLFTIDRWDMFPRIVALARRSAAVP